MAVPEDPCLTWQLGPGPSNRGGDVTAAIGAPATPVFLECRVARRMLHSIWAEFLEPLPQEGEVDGPFPFAEVSYGTGNAPMANVRFDVGAGTFIVLAADIFSLRIGLDAGLAAENVISRARVAGGIAELPHTRLCAPTRTLRRDVAAAATETFELPPFARGVQILSTDPTFFNLGSATVRVLAGAAVLSEFDGSNLECSAQGCCGWTLPGQATAVSIENLTAAAFRLTLPFVLGL